MASHRFKKIATKMYADEKFQSLSAPEPNGQSLWIYLISGPHNTSIPGLFSAGKASLAEGLNWTMEGFLKAFHEVSSRGMVKADWSRRVVWIPNAISYNEPESPNVVKGWMKYWGDISECELKHDAAQHLKDYLKVIGKAFAEAFTPTIKQVSVRPSVNPEPEPEQEPEPDKIHTRAKKTSSDAPVGFVKFWDTWPEHFRKKDRPGCLKVWRKEKLEEIAERIISGVESHKRSPGWGREKGQYIPGPAKWLREEAWNTPLLGGMADGENGRYEEEIGTPQELIDANPDMLDWIQQPEEMSVQELLDKNFAQTQEAAEKMHSGFHPVHASDNGEVHS